MTLSGQLHDPSTTICPPSKQVRLPLHALLTVWQHGYQKCGLRQNATPQTDTGPF